MKLNDLLILGFSKNPYYFEIFKPEDINDENFSINLEKNIWSYYSWMKIPVGEKRTIEGSYPMNTSQYLGGIIGVYNKKSIEQLNSMVFDLNDYIHKEGCKSSLTYPKLLVYSN